MAIDDGAAAYIPRNDGGAGLAGVLDSYLKWSAQKRQIAAENDPATQELYKQVLTKSGYDVSKLNNIPGAELSQLAHDALTGQQGRQIGAEANRNEQTLPGDVEFQGLKNRAQGLENQYQGDTLPERELAPWFQNQQSNASAVENTGRGNYFQSESNRNAAGLPYVAPQAAANVAATQAGTNEAGARAANIENSTTQSQTLLPSELAQRAAALAATQAGTGETEARTGAIDQQTNMAPYQFMGDPMHSRLFGPGGPLAGMSPGSGGAEAAGFHPPAYKPQTDLQLGLANAQGNTDKPGINFQFANPAYPSANGGPSSPPQRAPTSLNSPEATNPGIIGGQALGASGQPSSNVGRSFLDMARTSPQQDQQSNQQDINDTIAMRNHLWNAIKSRFSGAMALPGYTPQQ